ncbi:MAG: PSP1 domain-containing protein, partial [Candidatus Omnitrophica bacterium]|nr:PSP1 domain-containing protein [Candidatus Omnitrophota bacterium]
MDRIALIETRRVDKPINCRVAESVEVKKGDYCIIEYTQGTQDWGRVLSFMPSPGLFRVTLAGKVIRPVSQQDCKIIEENRNRKVEAFRIAQEKIKAHGLTMKLVDVEYSFDRSRITFYYWAEGRIDFRRLVRDLASVFNCRIEMRQIGPRDEARAKGGYGICGRQLCCALWLREFESITMRMVKNQKLP